MAWWYSVNMTCPGNMSVLLFLCANGHCINNSLICDHINHCGDGSDEDNKYARCHHDEFPVSGTVVAGIVIGTVVGIAILCCVVGTVVDCFVHIYKYWCASCLRPNKAAYYQTEMVVLPPGAAGRHQLSGGSQGQGSGSGSEQPSAVLVVRTAQSSGGANGYASRYSNVHHPNEHESSETVPMLQPSSSKNKRTELLMRLSKAAIRDCITQMDDDDDDETDSDDDLRGRAHNRSTGTYTTPRTIIPNLLPESTSLLTREFRDIDDLSLTGAPSVNRATSTGDLAALYELQTSASSTASSSVRGACRPKTVHKKALMVSRDMQTEDLMTYAVACEQTELLVSVHPKSELSTSEKASLCTAPTLPPSYSSIFHQPMHSVDQGISYNGYVELPPKQPPPPD